MNLLFDIGQVSFYLLERVCFILNLAYFIIFVSQRYMLSVLFKFTTLA